MRDYQMRPYSPALLTAIALLAGCASPSPVAMATQDIAFIGGCWERHDAGNADFLRLLRDREHPGGFVGDQSKIRTDEETYTSRWIFAPGGSGVIWASTTGPSDELSIYAPAKDLPEEDRAVPLNGKAAFFWDRPGQLYLRVLREGDTLRISRHAAKGSDARYASIHQVYFEGNLSGCD